MKIAVYCGSTSGNGDKFREAARRLGDWIGANGHTLVYGGGEAGLMGETAKAAHAHGGEVIGVLPGNVAFICNRPQPYCTQVLTMPDMSSRKQRMLELADAFIALPGGIGTLDEITEAITLTRIGVFKKPSVLIDTDGYYQPLRRLLDGMVAAGFMAPEDLRMVLASEDMEEIGRFLMA